jgi:hypothetical protein
MENKNESVVVFKNNTLGLDVSLSEQDLENINTYAQGTNLDFQELKPSYAWIGKDGTRCYCSGRSKENACNQTQCNIWKSSYIDCSGVAIQKQIGPDTDDCGLTLTNRDLVQKVFVPFNILDELAQNKKIITAETQEIVDQPALQIIKQTLFEKFKDRETAVNIVPGNRKILYGLAVEQKNTNVQTLIHVPLLQRQ